MRDESDHGGAPPPPSNALLRWIDDRTGYQQVLHEVLDEPIPGGARWRYVFGSALTATFLIQVVTGLLLMTSYSPSSTTAWGSVYYINYQMTAGWFLRGIHHFGSQAMVVLLGLHLLQVLIAGAYRAPREFNWWFGMLLLIVTLGLSLTGYLLPWDQKGYWATKVATNIMGGAPGLGPYLQKIVVGGDDYGNQTLTRFYGLHVGILPAALILLLAIHIALFRRHGVTHPRNTRGIVEKFWPRQVAFDTIASALVLAGLVGMVLYEHGANLDAPADPSSSDYPARPEWYFLSLFQMLKLFPGELEVVGTVVVPSAILVVLLALPLLDKILPRGLAHFFACSFVFALIGGAGYLTFLAVNEDAHNQRFQQTRKEADEARLRAIRLASDPEHGISPRGAGYLLREDPGYHGRAVLTSRCLSCHYYDGKGQTSEYDIVVTAAERRGLPEAKPLSGEPAMIAQLLAAKVKGFTPETVEKVQETPITAIYRYRGKSAQGEEMEVRVHANGSLIDVVTFSKQTASDLKGVATRDWVRGLLEDPSSSNYFGTNANLKGMKSWKKSAAAKKYRPEDLDALADFVAELAKVDTEETFEAWFDRVGEELAQHPGYASFTNDCGKCHVLGEAGAITEGGFMDAPNLFAYGSTRWLRRMIKQPGDPDYYGFLEKEDQMPPFGDTLSENDMNTLVRFLQGDYLK